jgi:hypothetical protein
VLAFAVVTSWHIAFINLAKTPISVETLYKRTGAPTRCDREAARQNVIEPDMGMV